MIDITDRAVFHRAAAVRRDFAADHKGVRFSLHRHVQKIAVRKTAGNLLSLRQNGIGRGIHHLPVAQKLGAPVSGSVRNGVPDFKGRILRNTILRPYVDLLIDAVDELLPLSDEIGSASVRVFRGFNRRIRRSIPDRKRVERPVNFSHPRLIGLNREPDR